jgi:hypothetical protein
MKAIDSLLEGLIDYAGLYPPAGLDMRSALRNYLSYGASKHAAVLGHFVVDLNRLVELREAAGDAVRDLRLSVVASPNTEWDELSWLLNEGFCIDAIEIKTEQPSEIESICKRVPSSITTYFEIPVHSCTFDVLQGISDSGSRAKLRMGGVVEERFPSTTAVANVLHALARSRIPFKATAGLHHPVRSYHPFNYEPDSPKGIMHGFLNLFLAAALMHCGGYVSDANLLLKEQDPNAWQMTSEAICWHSYRWSSDQLRMLREEFAISFGSCSFVEPIHDLEALRWL